MTSASRWSDSRHAHTLWEVLVVLTLLGAIATLVVPSLPFDRGRGDDVTATTRDLVTLLERGRSMALERGTTVDLRLDPTRGRAWIFAFDHDTLRLVEARAFTRVAAVEIIGDGARPRYVFASTGVGAGAPITVRGLGGSRRLTLDPWNGGVHVTPR